MKDNLETPILMKKSKISEHFFKSILNRKIVNSAHWFRIADLWHRVSFGYNNPLNYGRVHSELSLLIEKEKPLISLIKNFPIVFLGVGVGDTETQILDMQLNKYKITHTIGVDINKDFLELFANSLNLRKIENPKFEIHIKQIQKYFEDIKQYDFSIFKNETKVICILGNTIGNYNDTQDIFNIVNKISNSGDIIILGYQLNYNIITLFEKYKNNHRFIDFIGNYLPERNKRHLRWKINEENSSIEAWLDDIQIFRSKKFSNSYITEISKKNSFKSVSFWNDNYKNMCIHILKKH